MTRTERQPERAQPKVDSLAEAANDKRDILMDLYKSINRYATDTGSVDDEDLQRMDISSIVEHLFDAGDLSGRGYSFVIEHTDGEPYAIKKFVDFLRHLDLEIRMNEQGIDIDKELPANVNWADDLLQLLFSLDFSGPDIAAYFNELEDQLDGEGIKSRLYFASRKYANEMSGMTLFPDAIHAIKNNPESFGNTAWNSYPDNDKSDI